jgi:hypothetical protein
VTLNPPWIFGPFIHRINKLEELNESPMYVPFPTIIFPYSNIMKQGLFTGLSQKTKMKLMKNQVLLWMCVMLQLLTFSPLKTLRLPTNVT